MVSEVASFPPDVIDKFLADVLHVVPYGRTYMYGIPVLISVVVAEAFRDIKIGLAWAVGHFAHLVRDISLIPWWYPLMDYDWPGTVNVV